MHNRLLSLYQKGALTEKGLANAVKKGWISQEDMQKILEGR